MRTCIGLLCGALAIFNTGEWAAAQTTPAPATSNWAMSVSAFVEDIGPNFTNNAFLTERNAKSDVSISPTYGIEHKGVSGPWLLSLRGGGNSERYSRFSELDSDTLLATARLAYSMPGLWGAERWVLSSSYAPRWIFGSGYDNLQLGVHDFNAVALGIYKWGHLSVSPAFAARRRLSSSPNAEYYRVGSSVEFGWSAPGGLQFVVKPSAFYSLHDVSPIAAEDRRSLLFGVDVGVSYDLSDELTLSAAFNFSRNTSNIDVGEYSVVSGGPVVTLTRKF